jgi:hypothetical protein
MTDSHNRKGISRRATIVSLSAAPLFTTGVAQAGQPDESVAACENWLALNAEHQRLSRRWSSLEAQLARTHNFLNLSRRQQRRLPEAQEFQEIDDRLEQLHEQKQALLALLPTLVATSPFGLAGKLEVAAIEVCPEENEEAHHLIASILRDLKAMAPASV